MSYLILPDEVEFRAIRAQGPGGQNVNKVSTSVHLRFDIRKSSLPEAIKERLLKLPDRRITKGGIVVIKAQSSRSRDQNKAEALARLNELVAQASRVRAVRRPTKPTRASQRRRLQSKARRSETKAARKTVSD